MLWTLSSLSATEEAVGDGVSERGKSVLGHKIARRSEIRSLDHGQVAYIFLLINVLVCYFPVLTTP